MGKRSSCFLVLVAVGLVATTTFAAQTIRIGVELPMTGFGAMYGEDARRAVELAVDEANQAGGIRGKQLEAVFEDDGGIGKTAVSATQKLVNVDKVPLIIGGMMSSAGLTAAPVAKENNVVFIATISSHPELTGPGGYVYRVQSTDRINANAAGKFAARELKVKRGVGLFASSDYGKSLEKFTRASFEAEGGEWLMTESFSQGSSDFRSQLTKIKQKDPGIIFVAATVKEAAQILRQMVELRMEIPILGSSMLDDPQLTTLAGEAAERVYYHRPAKITSEEAKEREAAFKEKFTVKFPGKEPGIAAKYYYDAIGLAFEGIRLGGETGPEIDKGMRKIRDFPGLTGTINFNDIGDREFAAAVVKIENGEPIETGFTNSE